MQGRPIILVSKAKANKISAKPPEKIWAHTKIFTLRFTNESRLLMTK